MQTALHSKNTDPSVAILFKAWVNIGIKIALVGFQSAIQSLQSLLCRRYQSIKKLVKRLAWTRVHFKRVPVGCIAKKTKLTFTITF